MPLEFRLPVDGAADALVVALDVAAAREREPTPVDLSVAPGAALALARAWELGAGERLELLCVTASASRWAPGLERAVLDGATAVARRLGGFTTSLPSELATEGPRVAQSFALTGGPDPVGPALRQAGGPDPVGPAASLVAGGRIAIGRHVLGFAAPERTIVLCSALCTSPQPSAACEAAVPSLALKGALGPAPEGGLLVRALLYGAAHPVLVVALLALATVVAVSVLLWRRPRPHVDPTGHTRRASRA